jgi:hypothetical protein
VLFVKIEQVKIQEGGGNKNLEGIKNKSGPEPPGPLSLKLLYLGDVPKFKNQTKKIYEKKFCNLFLKQFSYEIPLFVNSELFWFNFF